MKHLHAKKILALLLCTLILCSALPSFAEAEESISTPEESMGVEPILAEPPSREESEEEAPGIPGVQQAEEKEDAISPEEAGSEPAEEAEPLAELAEEAEPAVDPAEEEELEVALLPEFAHEAEGEENEALLNAYAEQQLRKALPRKPALRASKNVGAGFTGARLADYQRLRAFITQTAAGELTDTIYTVDLSDQNLRWTAEELGYDSFSSENANEAMSKALQDCGLSPVITILHALLADCPYELYWFDKTVGISAVPAGYRITASTITINSMKYSFAVADDYAAGEYQVSTAYADTITYAVEKAQSIVSTASAMTDYRKLDYYRAQICSMTSYNSSAQSGSPYGNPWQLIYVFDDDAGTSVVCEGYAKAFQYLCDLSSFHTPSICCYTVTGTIQSIFVGTGDHMWNIVTMEDGRNYLVDVTNCDGNTAGAPDLLFMKQYSSGTVDTSYRFNCNGNTVTYTYDASCRATYTNADLTLSTQAYDTAYPSPPYSLNRSELSLPAGGTYTLSMTDGTGAARMPAWSSSNPDVATVSSEGLVTARRYGTAVMTAVYRDITLSCTVSVLFSDVTESEAGQYYFNPVYWAAENGITTGYSDGSFGVGRDCQRRELMIFLWRYAGSPGGYGDARTMFNDLGSYGPSSATNQAIAWAYIEGISKGYPDGGFHPTASIVRKDVMIMLYRLADKPAVSGTLTFTDCRSLNKNSDTYRAILWGSQNGITNGYNSGPYKGQFGTNLNCLREQIVTFLFRYDRLNG